jgi:hypothetical protein
MKVEVEKVAVKIKITREVEVDQRRTGGRSGEGKWRGTGVGEEKDGGREKK